MQQIIKDFRPEAFYYASESTQLVWQWCFLFHYSLATSMTNWVKISQICYFMDMLGYTKWEDWSLTITKEVPVPLIAVNSCSRKIDGQTTCAVNDWCICTFNDQTEKSMYKQAPRKSSCFMKCSASSSLTSITTICMYMYTLIMWLLKANHNTPFLLS